MSTAPPQTRLTPDDLLAMPDGKGYELVDGTLVDSGKGSLASWVGGELFCRLRRFVAERRIGHVFSAGFGFCCFPRHPNTVCKPSVSFVRFTRLDDERPSRGYELIAPDLVVEMVSPWGLYCDLDRKIEDLFEVGTRLFWVVNCDLNVVHVHRPSGFNALLWIDDNLDGEDVLSGFSCRLGDLFLPPAESEP